ncbi:MAG: GrpB family protein [Pseudoxanthomonas sp.]
MIRVVAHDPAWSTWFEAEAERIAEAVGEAVVRIHHIGSTAIPQTKAKPIIDILMEVTSLGVLDRKAPMLEALGYEVMGEFGIPDRRYFRLDDSDGTRTHQVHAFEAGVPNVVRHLAFRDYMRAHPSVAGEYGALKERLANAHPHDRAMYVDGKDGFVKEYERRALLWASNIGVVPAA